MLVQKVATYEEVQVMLALAELPDSDVLPQVIGHSLALDTDDKFAS